VNYSSLTGQEVRILAVKTGAGVVEQGRYLQALRRTGVVVEVVRELEDGYVMPVLQQVQWGQEQRELAVFAAKTLSSYWYAELGVHWAFDPDAFLHYMAVRCDTSEAVRLQVCWRKIKTDLPTFCDTRCAQHGDLSWDNFMCDETERLWLIDALPPKAGSLPAPLADAGKLYLSSLAGWRGRATAVPEWGDLHFVAERFRVPPNLLRFAAATHLLRVRPYAKRSRNEAMLKFCGEHLESLLGL
jgi:hypothetical protein